MFFHLFLNLKFAIFTEILNSSKIDVYRRNLQKTYINILIQNLNPTTVTVRSIPPGVGYGFNTRIVDLNLTDLPSIVRMHLEKIQKEIKPAILTSTDTMSKAHLVDLNQRIENALNPNK